MELTRQRRKRNCVLIALLDVTFHGRNFLIQDSKFKCFSTGRSYKINQFQKRCLLGLVYWRNAIYSTKVLLPQNSKYVFAITSRLCSHTKKRASLQSIWVVPNTSFMKLVLLLYEKLTSQGDAAHTTKTGRLFFPISRKQLPLRRKENVLGHVAKRTWAHSFALCSWVFLRASSQSSIFGFCC